jgi:hypothetical protein
MGNAQRSQGPGRGNDRLAIATLVGVVGVLMISFANWREIDRIQETVGARLSQIETRLGEVAARPVAPRQAQRPSRGPDPARVYSIRTVGAPSRGPASAPVVIAEFSDFQ